ncbi:MAG: hypothetical protein HHAS10_04950 [Candidatus Altimarinota bacterium]
MDTYYSFSSHIGSLIKDKNFDEVLSYFKSHKSDFADEIRKDEYMIANILTALRKTKNHRFTHSFFDEFSINIYEKLSSRILTSYGWILFDELKASIKNKSDIGDSNLISDNNITLFLKNISNIKDDFSQSAFSQVFKSILDNHDEKGHWKQICEICKQIPYENLSTRNEMIEATIKGKQKEVELASDQEKWFGYYTKALLESGKYEECSELSTLALDIIKKFHNGNDIWFSRRIALSNQHLGNTELALEKLLKIYEKKKDWFIEKELAEIYVLTGDTKQAFEYAIRAMNNYGDLEFKVGVMILLGDLLINEKEDEIAEKHYILSSLIRKREGWKIPQNLSGKIKGSEVKDESFDVIKHDLIKYWKSLNKQQDIPKNRSERFEGEVVKIMNNNERGINGFIGMQDKSSVYFILNRDSDNNLINLIKIGTKVYFFIKESEGDKSKRKAFGIRII